MGEPTRTGSGTWAFLFSDIEQSTALLLRLGEGYDAVLQQHRDVVRRAIAAHGGEEENTEGDSFVVVFADGGSALRAAVEAQRMLAAEQWPAGVDLRIRIGLHAGAARRDAVMGLNGLAVHAAARIMSTGHGGQIVVSRALLELLPPGLATTRVLGTYRLKDIPGEFEIHQVLVEGLPGEFPPLRAVASRGEGGMPRTTTSFLGRDRQTARLSELLAAPGVVTLTGPPGSGKTRLAVESVNRFCTGRRTSFVDLATVTDPRLVAARVAEATGVDAIGQDLAGQIAEQLRNSEEVIVVDNCEHVVGEAADLVDRLSSSCPGLTIVCTTREPLGIDGEALLAVPPLSVDGAGTDGVSDAVQLFLDRAAALGVEVAETDVDAVHEVVRRLDGVPLAIELAAALTPVLTPPEIAGRLDSRFRLLVGTTGRSLSRHRTLVGAIEWGYELLDESDRAALRRLTVCSAPFDLATAEALLAGVFERDEVLSSLHRLVRSSWLSRDAGERGSRYRFLESIREFGRERAAAEGELDGLLVRHARHFLQRGDALSATTAGSESLVAFAQLDEIFPDLWAALALATADLSLLEEAVSSFLRLIRYWQARPSWSEVRGMAERLLVATADGSPVEAATRAMLMTNAAFQYRVDGRLPEAMALMEQALAAAEASGDPDAIAHGASLAVTLFDIAGAPRRAMEKADEAIRLGAQHGFVFARNRALLARACVLLQTDGVAAAWPDARVALDSALAAEDPMVSASAHVLHAELHELDGDVDAAVSCWDAAADARAGTIHQVIDIMGPLDRLRRTGSADDYRQALEAALARAVLIGSGGPVAELHRRIAIADLHVGAMESAAAHMRAIDASGRHPGQGPGHELSLTRAAVRWAAGDHDGAVTFVRGELQGLVVAGLVGPAWRMLWVLAHWDGAIADEDLRARVREATAAAFATFGYPWELEVYAGVPRPPVPAGGAATDLHELVAAVLAEAGPGVGRS